MPKNKIHAGRPISSLHRDLSTGNISSSDITKTALELIGDCDHEVHAFTHVDPEAAIRAAERADREIRASGVRSPLHGIPIVVKDNIDVYGMATTCNSFAASDRLATKDATVVTRLRAAGAIVLGKSVTHEFALGDANHDGPFPVARNPWNTSNMTGGSSSGSAAAVSAGYARLALGTCTGGSIRIPAAWCGVVGLKPTYGRVSRQGIFPLAPSLDHCGVLTANVEEAAFALQVMAGHDPLDPSTVLEPVPNYLENLHGGFDGLRLGWPEALIARLPLSAGVRGGLENLVRLLEENGVSIDVAEFEDEHLHAASGRIIVASESYSVHLPILRRNSSRYGKSALPRIAAGGLIRAAQYLVALKVRQQLRRSIDETLSRCDVMLLPITLETAPLFDADGSPSRLPILPYVGNVTGHPAISIPIGFETHTGLPLAVQLIARHFGEPVLLRVATAIEKLIEKSNSTGRTDFPHHAVKTRRM